MAVTIITTRQPLDATQQGYLQKLFGSPAFSLLKEMVAARCIEHQIAAMKADVYPNNPDAVTDYQIAKNAAVQHAAVLDVLDDIESSEQEWWTIKLDPRR